MQAILKHLIQLLLVLVTVTHEADTIIISVLLGWPKISGFFFLFFKEHMKNLNELFGQPNT